MLTLFLLSMALQSVPAEACHMDLEQAPVTHHAGMDNDFGEHDCCSDGAPETEHACGDALQCGTCTPGLTLIAGPSNPMLIWDGDRLLTGADGRIAASHSSPPFRPPISS